MLLRLLRLISVPRLFTLVLGDVATAETILNLKLSSSLAQVADGVTNAAMLSVEPQEVGMMAGSVAAHTLRKLIPPAQRILLEPWMLHKALNFRPLGHDPNHEPRLHQLLAQCPVVFDGDAAGESSRETLPKFSGHDIDNLRDFLLLKKIPLIGPRTPMPERPIGEEVTQADLDQELYRVPRLFKTTSRRLTDLWMALREVCNADPEQPREIRAKAVREVLKNHCYSLLEEEAFPPDARRKLLRAFRGRPGGTWEFDPLTRALTPTFYPGAGEHVIDVLTHAYDPQTWRLQVRVRSVQDWWLTSSEPDRSERDWSERDLSEDLALALVLLHDLLAVGPESFSGSWLTAVPVGGLFVMEWRSRTSRTQNVELPCPAIPPWESFWDMALFRHVWSDAIDRVRTSQLLHEDALRTLTFAWIAAGTAVVERRDPVRLASEVTQRRDWQRLYERLESLVRPREANTSRAIRARNWLTSVAIFLMPESGLPDGPALQALTSANRLLEFWNQQGRLISEQRALRLAQLVKNGMLDLAERLRLHPLPEGLSVSRLRPGKTRVANLAEGLDTLDDEESEAETDEPPSSPRPTRPRRVTK